MFRHILIIFTAALIISLAIGDEETDSRQEEDSSSVLAHRPVTEIVRGKLHKRLNCLKCWKPRTAAKCCKRHGWCWWVYRHIVSMMISQMLHEEPLCVHIKWNSDKSSICSFAAQHRPDHHLKCPQQKRTHHQSPEHQGGLRRPRKPRPLFKLHRTQI